MSQNGVFLPIFEKLAEMLLLQQVFECRLNNAFAHFF